MRLLFFLNQKKTLLFSIFIMKKNIYLKNITEFIINKKKDLIRIASECD